MRPLILFAVVVLCATQTQALEPIGASKVAADFTSDRLARLLQVNQVAISVSAERAFTSASVQIDFYHNGKKVHTETSASAAHLAPQEAVKISLQTADLKLLPLTDGKPGFTRFLVELTTSGEGPSMYAAQSHDIAKAICSLGKINGASAFAKPSMHDGKIPLCWMLHDNATESTSVTAGIDPPDLAEKNPTADIVVVNLSLTNETDPQNESGAAR